MGLTQQVRPDPQLTPRPPWETTVYDRGSYHSGLKPRPIGALARNSNIFHIFGSKPTLEVSVERLLPKYQEYIEADNYFERKKVSNLNHF